MNINGLSDLAWKEVVFPADNFNTGPVDGVVWTILKPHQNEAAVLLLTASIHTEEGVWMNSESSAWTFKLCVLAKKNIYLLI